MQGPSNRNATPSRRSTGVSSGARNRALTAGARTQTTPKQATPTARPAVEAARTWSMCRVGFCTSAEASPIRTKNWANSTTRLAMAISPKATGSSSREMVTV